MKFDPKIDEGGRDNKPKKSLEKKYWDNYVFASITPELWINVQ